MSASELLATGFYSSSELNADCQGQVAALRFNRVREGGSIAGYREAVSDHQAWVHAQGDSDVQFLILEGGVRVAGGEDNDRFIGNVIIYPSLERYEAIIANRVVDADFDAFVAKYDANTEGFVALNVCMTSP